MLSTRAFGFVLSLATARLLGCGGIVDVPAGSSVTDDAGIANDAVVTIVTEDTGIVVTDDTGVDDTHTDPTENPLCAATCSSAFGVGHPFPHPNDLSAIVGRWISCTGESLPPLDQAGVELTADGRFIILRRAGDGAIVEDDSAHATWKSGGAAEFGGEFSIALTNAPYVALLGDLSDCPTRLRLQNISGHAPYPVAEYVFDPGRDPHFDAGAGCSIPSNGCDYCGNLTCPEGSSIDSSCRCVPASGPPVAPVSQTCDFCCGKKCAAGEFLDYECNCYRP
jgi:hypothetical protein